MMFILVDKDTILPYNGEVLKRFIGNRLVNTISNPTDEQLSEFGFLELVEDDIPEYDIYTQCLSYEFILKDGKIHKVFTVSESDNNTEDVADIGENIAED